MASLGSTFIGVHVELASEILLIALQSICGDRAFPAQPIDSLTPTTPKPRVLPNVLAPPHLHTSA